MAAHVGRGGADSFDGGYRLGQLLKRYPPKLVTGIPNNIATTILTATVPNQNCACMMHISYIGSEGAGGAVGAFEASGGDFIDLAITRTKGVAAGVAGTAVSAVVANVSGGDGAFSVVAAFVISGGVTAVNTVAIQFTLARGGGAATNHQIVVSALLINAVKTSLITLA